MTRNADSGGQCPCGRRWVCRESDCSDRDLLLARQDALVRYLGRAEFLRAVGEADPCEVSPITRSGTPPESDIS